MSALSHVRGHRILWVCGKGSKIVLAPLPPAVERALDRATADRKSGQSCLVGVGCGRTGAAPPDDCVAGT